MKIITRGEAMRIHQQHPASRLFPFCTGKYRWHGSTEAYTGREVQDIPGVLAVFAERRKDSFWPICPVDERHPELSLEGHSDEQNYRHHRTILNRFSVRTLSCQTHCPGQRIPTTTTTAPVGAALHRDALFRGTSGAGG